MFSKKVKTTEGDKLISIPSDKSEVTIGMLMDLKPGYGDALSPLEAMSVLTGIPSGNKPGVTYPDEVFTLCDICDVEGFLNDFNETLELLGIQIKACLIDAEVPDVITVPVKHEIKRRWFGRKAEHAGKLVKVAKNLGIEPAGAYMEAKEIIAEEFKHWDAVKEELGDHIEFSPSIHSLCRVLSLYLYTRSTGEKFNSQRAAEFDEVTKQLSITKALPIARFFFLRYQTLLKRI